MTRQYGDESSKKILKMNITTEELSTIDYEPSTQYGDTTETEREEFWEYRLSLLVQAYAGIVIVILGLCGNTLVIATIGQKRPYSSTSIYLLNLAAADLTVTLIGQLSRVFPRALTGFDTGSQHPWICKWWFFINHSAKTISGWTLVAVTIERVIVVYFPFKARELCTRTRSKVAIAFINFLCAACYLHYFWTYGSVYEERNGEHVLVAGCTIVKDNPDIVPYMTYIRPWQDFVIRSAAPFFALFVCNILIIVKLVAAAKKRSSMAGKDQQQDDGMRSMTAMLLTVSFAHLICISPMQIMYLIDKSDPFGWTMEYRWQAVVALRWSFAIDVYYANHAINFILYCISGREFRRDVKNLVLSKIPLINRCCKADLKLEHATSVRTLSTASRAVSTVSIDVEKRLKFGTGLCGVLMQ